MANTPRVPELVPERVQLHMGRPLGPAPVSHRYHHCQPGSSSSGLPRPRHRYWPACWPKTGSSGSGTKGAPEGCSMTRLNRKLGS